MTIDTVLFDLDGTITDSLPLIERTYAKVFKEMGLPWGKGDVMKLIGLPLREIGRIMAGAGKEEDFFDIYQRHYRQDHEKYMSIFSGTVRMLSILKKRAFSLGVVTSKSRYGTNMTLTLLNLKNFFNIVVTADDTRQHKPHPEPVLFALNQLKKHPKQVVYVGDSPFDIAAGNRAGVVTAAVTWGMAKEDELRDHQPSIIVHSRSQLLKWVQKQQ